VRAQWQAKQEGALEWRIRRANLPERWTLETFPFARQPGVNRKQIRGFAELEFIAKAENIVLVGKTELATFCTPRHIIEKHDTDIIHFLVHETSVLS